MSWWLNMRSIEHSRQVYFSTNAIALLICTADVRFVPETALMAEKAGNV